MSLRGFSLVYMKLVLTLIMASASVAFASDEIFFDAGDDEQDVSTAVAPTKAPAPVPPKAKAEAKAIPKKQIVSLKAPVRKAASSGQFLIAKESCPMMAEPAAGGEPILQIKASRKIWVEAVDAEWVRAYDRTGAPGYISRSCFK